MNYPYANGIIKTLESKILNKEALIRLNHSSREAMLKDLVELGYGSVEATNLEELIASEFTKLKELYLEIAPNPELISLLFINDDAINIKIVLKKRLFVTNLYPVYAKNGMLNVNDLEAWLLNDQAIDRTFKDKKQRKLFAKVYSLTNKDYSSRVLSAKVDEIVYEIAFMMLKGIDAQPFKIYFMKKIDYTNLISLIRARKLHWEKSNLHEMLIKGGEIPLSHLLEIYELSDEEVVESLKIYEFEKISQVIKNSLDFQDLGLLELYLENHLLQTVKSYFANSFDFGPMLYYALMKFAEAQNIRTIAANPQFASDHLLDY